MFYCAGMPGRLRNWYDEHIVKTFLFGLIATACLASFTANWNKPFPAHRVIGNLYYVGTNQLASYLVTTNEGHILINTSYEESVPLIEANVKKLGYQFKDIKIILLSHTHDDHCAGTAKVKQLTKAKLMVMDADVKEMEDGGESDFQYPDMRWTPVKVDRVLHDGNEVELGGAVLTAHKTPGHTKGCTTWTMRIANRDVVIVGSPNVNEGYRLLDNAKYPEIVNDYEHTFSVLKSLRCDVFLGAHGSYYGMEEKYHRLMAGGSNPFIDPRGYQTYVEDREIAFKNELRKQRSK
jgi:metallo-beta-lactamase class B